MTMITIETWVPGLAELWSRVWEESSDAWFWHRRDWADYQWSYGHSRRLEDLSFVVLNRGRAAAICPVFLEQMLAPHEGHAELAFAGSAIPAPAASDWLTKRQRRDVLSAAYEHLAELAHRRCAERVTVAHPPCLTGDRVADQMAGLQEHGYLDISFLTQVLDLSRGRDPLWSDVRSSYRPLINRGQRELKLSVYCREHPAGTAFDEYQKLHAAAAGRVTRPQRTFDLMHDWVGRGSALLVEAVQGTRPVGYALLLCAKQGAYYGSGCCAPDVDLPYLMHSLQWTSVSALLERGIRWYELGHQHFRPTLAHPADPKARAISFFKRGLGGMPRMCVSGELYLSQSMLRAVVEHRLRVLQSDQSHRSAED